ncbi:DASS family sodium-coupled anion symporter [Bifidobacterium sp. ESL0798]|uniref:DASS family sodium-coupled anion symporter n=1 Tax=Bifidobacterium sp. ESL0798 TaxID=2983235 RepID=UPI0023F8D1C9|nr:DASS family sodium-coupled anion symporter [Bifidobacterium sp. ESL0798]WEV73957.1 DASS family sodium-coupled anion symporter [Bifidobacterium sp. ESL0798]
MSSVLTKKKIPLALFLLCCIGLIFMWFTPAPAHVQTAGWHSFAIVLFFLAGCVLNVAPLSILSLTMMSLLGLTFTMPAGTLISFFGSGPVWLVLFAFFMAIGFRKTNLGARMAYWLIAHFGRSPLALAYVMAICDLILAPVIPNTNARGAGILFPINQSLVEALDEPKDPSKRSVSSFLTLATFHLNLIIGGLFLTSMATNPLVASMAASTFHITISWFQWFTYASVPTLLAAVIVPIVILAIHHPESQSADLSVVHKTAQNALKKMPKMAVNEYLMIAAFVLVVILWGTSSVTKLDNTIIALLGLTVLLVLRIIDLDDVFAEKQGWNILLWLAPLIGVTGYLNETGVVGWIKKVLTSSVAGIPAWLAIVVIVLLYLYVHYLLTSVLVHVQTFFIPFALILVSIGVPPIVATMLLGLLTCVSPGTTHYGTGTASIYFSTGYVSQKEWWKTGFIVSLVNLVIYAGVGTLWWKLLGLW